MSGHTPGPWRVAGDLNTEVVARKRRLVADCLSDDPDLDQDRANARLIATAPEMLELLRDMTDYGERGRVPESHWCERARVLLERI